MAEAATAAAGDSPASEDHGFIVQLDGPGSNALDADQLEAQEALAALALEEAGGAVPGQGEGDGAPAPAPDPAPAAAPNGQSEPQPIPYSRFREVNERLREERERSAYWEGVAAAHAQRGQPGGGQDPAPAPDPQQQLNERLQTARQAVQTSAEKLDAGEITAAQHEAARIAYEDERDAIAAERANLAQQATARQSPAKPTTPNYALSDEQILNEQVVKLETDHPYLVQMTPQHLAVLKDKAYALAEAEGIEIGTGPRGDMALRGLIGRLSDTWGPKWGIQAQQQPNPQAPAATAGQPQLSPTAKARQDKLALAAQHAPNTATLGAAGSGDGAGIPTDEKILSMSDDEIALLPAAVREKFMRG